MKTKKTILALAIVITSLAACNLPAPATPVQSTPALGTAVAAIQTVSAINTETAAPAISPIPLVILPTMTPFLPATPSPYLQVAGKIVAKDGAVWVETEFSHVVREYPYQDEYVELRMQINGTSVWYGSSNGGELNSPMFVLNDGDIVQIFVDEILVAHMGDMEFDIFVNR